jgi:hypothetical protein
MQRTARYTWNTDYATYVHEGVTFRRTVRSPGKGGKWVTIKKGTKYPARRWTEYALANFEFTDVFTHLFGTYAAKMPLPEAGNKAFEETCLLLGRAFTEAISSPVWAWKDGNRDIVNDGQLRASQRIEFIGT